MKDLLSNIAIFAIGMTLALGIIAGCLYILQLPELYEVMEERDALKIGNNSRQNRKTRKIPAIHKTRPKLRRHVNICYPSPDCVYC
jgi:hypothetical protein